MTYIAPFSISVGRGNGLYTLRQFDRYDHYGDPIFSYVKNLSRDPFVALDKAKNYVANKGYNPDADLDDFDPSKISGLTAWGECDPWKQERIERAKRHVMPFGKYFGEKLSDVPVSYLADFILAQDIDSIKSDTVVEIIRRYVVQFKADEFKAYVVEAKNKILVRDAELEAIRNKSKHFGNVGDRIELEATIVFSKGFDNFYGVTYINSLVDNDGNHFVYRGNELGNAGDVVTLKATIKEHSEYNGVKQTVFNRPKILGE